MTGWTKTSDELPPFNTVVETKIHDCEGVRNQGYLKLGATIGGSLWFAPDDQSYVYYTPTHWRPK